MGLSSCFILLGSSLLYANSGTTILDGIYVITSLSDIGNNSQISAENTLYWYKPYYINFSLLIMSIGFLFKVSAAPFHFWSPERWFGKSSKTLSSCLRGQLPNSGNALKLKVPSYSWKTICGWTNYSDFFYAYLLNKQKNKVTSLNTSEKRVGNRGSKSVTSLYLNTLQTVKEQRVYGNWYEAKSAYLRCILLDFERNRLVKIPSNQIMAKRLYTNSNNIKLKTCSLLSLPWFVTGFTDAEGCFTIIARKSSRSRTGWKIEANFIINLHKRDVKLLKDIKDFFGGIGRVSKEKNGCCDFTVSSLDQIITGILPHFDKYPLVSQKLADYILFREVIIIMQQGGHLTLEGLKAILNIRASINRGLTPALKEAFPGYVPVTRPLVDVYKLLPLHPYWIAGFAAGDGSFMVKLRFNKDYNAGGRVELAFVLTQHVRDLALIKCLADYFGCGQYYSYKDYAEFKCCTFKYIYEKILPFFLKYPILGVKSKDFEDWIKVADIINSKAHLTKEGFEEIQLIKNGMNKGRYNNE